MKKLAGVCLHIDRGEKAIVWALRDAPGGETESGWVFLCAAAEVGIMGNRVPWPITRVLKDDPSLTSLVDGPVGAILQKQDSGWWRRLR